MANPYSPDYSKRTHSSQHNSAVASGYAVDFVHIPSGATNFEVAPARSVVTLLSINVAPGSGNVILTCGTDQVMQAALARDYKMGWYAYAPVFISLPDTTTDATVYVAPPSKGAVAGQ